MQTSVSSTTFESPDSIAVNLDTFTIVVNEAKLQNSTGSVWEKLVGAQFWATVYWPTVFRNSTFHYHGMNYFLGGDFLRNTKNIQQVLEHVDVNIYYV